MVCERPPRLCRFGGFAAFFLVAEPPLLCKVCKEGLCTTKEIAGLSQEWRGRRFPSLHRRKEGWLRHLENVAEPPKRRRRARSASAIARSLKGGFPFVGIGKPPRPLQERRLRHIFLDVASTPPCGDARRGIACLAILRRGAFQGGDFRFFKVECGT